jgi:hypothetical protein
MQAVCIRVGEPTVTLADRLLNHSPFGRRVCCHLTRSKLSMQASLRWLWRAGGCRHTEARCITRTTQRFHTQVSTLRSYVFFSAALNQVTECS